MRKDVNEKNEIKSQSVHLVSYNVICCPTCGGKVIPYWEPKYNGIRATCHLCRYNWAES